MVYKKYRYIIVLKIILLLVWGFLFYQQRERPSVDWGTVFYVSHQPWTGSTTIDRFLETANLPWPWALVSTFSWNYVLHVPRTYDKEYIVRYLKQPIPDFNTPIDATIYEGNCQKKVRLTNMNTREMEKCEWLGEYDTLTAVVLLLIWLIL